MNQIIDLEQVARDKPVIVPLVGEDGNAFAILGRCRGAMRRAGWQRAEIDAFMAEVRGGDYNHLLQTVVKYTSEAEEWDNEEE